MARYWVGGATGFLGSAVVRALRADGHDVVAVARGRGEVAGVPVQAVDAGDAAAVEASARGVDGAFLLTGLVSRDPAHAERLHHANVVVTRQALLGLRRAGVPRVVYASTSGTVAISSDPVAANEESPIPREHIARFPYYRSKLYGELEALEANDPPRFEVVVVNPSLLLGPGDVRGSSTEDVRRLLDGEILAVPGGGLAFVDVRDAARGAIAALERGVAGERYLLSAVNLTVAAFLQRVARIAGLPPPRLPLPASPDLAGGATRLFARIVEAAGGRAPVEAESVEIASLFWYCDPQRAVDELGFQPRDPGETLRDTVVDLVERGVAHPRRGQYSEEGLTQAEGLG
ncbi:MAG: NAD-dependent epimerase/dehydratase family protein [Deltaproteobacteria bacterium]|nr:NAD-dependent epimerase/dehydratase family protein [Deltaproteobacteria bacterium]